MTNDRLQTEEIAIHAEAANLPDRDWSNKRMMAKRLTLIDVAQMNFDSWDFHTCDCIADGNARVRVRARIDHDAVLLIDRAVNRVNQDALMVRLQRG